MGVKRQNEAGIVPNKIPRNGPSVETPPVQIDYRGHCVSYDVEVSTLLKPLLSLPAGVDAIICKVNMG